MVHELENVWIALTSNLLKGVIDEARFILHTNRKKLNHQDINVKNILES